MHVSDRTVGTAGARLVALDQSCPWLSGAWLRNVHIIDDVLLPSTAALYAATGPYAVTQSLVNVPRPAVRGRLAARECEAAG